MGIKELIEKLEINEEDFKVKIGTVKKAHKKVVDAISTAWHETNGWGLAKVAFAPKGGTYGIDFVGREWEQGKISLAVEVDTWFRPYRSWMKLTDIRSINKIWVYLTNDKRARENFEEAISEINALLKARGEDKATLGNFIAIMKTPREFQVKEISV